MPYMDPDLFQRLTLVNQYTILAAVDPSSKDTWEAAAEAVRSNWPSDDLPFIEEMQDTARRPLTAEDRTRIHDIMELYALLQDAEAGGVVPASSDGSAFPGFDGNNETQLMSYARDMVQRRGLYSYLKLSSKDLNSHHRTQASYDAMLAEYAALGKPNSLSASAYKAIKLV